MRKSGRLGPLVLLAACAGAPTDPQLSQTLPNGPAGTVPTTSQTLAFIDYSTGQTDIFLIGQDSAVRRLTFGRLVRTVGWLSDARLLYTYGEAYDVAVMAADGQNDTTITLPQSPAGPVSVTGDATVFYYAKAGTIYRYNRTAGGAPRALRFGATPAVRSDDAVIAFTDNPTTPAGPFTALALMTPDGVSRTELLPIGTGAKSNLQWARDGQHLYYYQQGYSKDGIEILAGIYSIDVTTRETRRRVAAPEGSSQRWGVNGFAEGANGEWWVANDTRDPVTGETSNGIAKVMEGADVAAVNFRPRAYQPAWIP